MDDRREMVDAFARLREREGNTDRDLHDWQLEVWETWGEERPRVKINWGYAAFWTGYVLAVGYVAWQVVRWAL